MLISFMSAARMMDTVPPPREYFAVLFSPRPEHHNCSRFFFRSALLFLILTISGTTSSVKLHSPCRKDLPGAHQQPWNLRWTTAESSAQARLPTANVATASPPFAPCFLRQLSDSLTPLSPLSPPRQSSDQQPSSRPQHRVPAHPRPATTASSHSAMQRSFSSPSPYH